MSALERAALDYVDEVAHRPGVMLEFTLEPGEAMFYNNFLVMHARTAFEDDRAAGHPASPAPALARRAGRPAGPEGDAHPRDSGHRPPARQEADGGGRRLQGPPAGGSGVSAMGMEHPTRETRGESTATAGDGASRFYALDPASRSELRGGDGISRALRGAGSGGGAGSRACDSRHRNLRAGRAPAASGNARDLRGAGAAAAPEPPARPGGRGLPQQLLLRGPQLPVQLPRHGPGDHPDHEPSSHQDATLTAAGPAADRGRPAPGAIPPPQGLAYRSELSPPAAGLLALLRQAAGAAGRRADPLRRCERRLRGASGRDEGAHRRPRGRSRAAGHRGARTTRFDGETLRGRSPRTSSRSASPSCGLIP